VIWFEEPVCSDDVLQADVTRCLRITGFLRALFEGAREPSGDDLAPEHSQPSLGLELRRAAGRYAAR
jgi:hypothetical protein